MRNATQRKLMTVLLSAFIALACVVLGYVVCSAVPVSTQIVANSTIQEGSSPFQKSLLVEGACSVRDYCFAAHDEQTLYETIAHMNDVANTPYAGASEEELKNAPAQYTIDSTALSHLDDVYDLSSRMTFPLIGIFVLTMFLALMSSRMFGRRVVARGFFWGGTIGTGIVIVIGIFAVISFEGFFSNFHSILFEEGTWLFPSDSLLIAMLPGPFWAAMALLWCLSTVVFGALFAIAGNRVTKRVDATLASSSD